jgi:hypothetical protein
LLTLTAQFGFAGAEECVGVEPEPKVTVPWGALADAKQLVAQFGTIVTPLLSKSLKLKSVMFCAMLLGFVSKFVSVTVKVPLLAETLVKLKTA